MTGPLGVSHLLLFSRSSSGNTNLRLALTPRGPTLHFRIESYSLCKDIQKAMKHPRAGSKDNLTPPLLVMNNFTSPPPTDESPPAIPKHLESLTTTIFQSLFPPISPQTTPLPSIRRVLLLNRDPPAQSSTGASKEDGAYVLNLRHYAITTKRTGLSRGIRRLNAAEKNPSKPKSGRKGNLPNLGKLDDVADYLLDPSAAGGGFTSGSESEVETDAEVEVLETNTRKVMNKKQLETSRNKPRDDDGEGKRVPGGVEKRAVKLVELGPRMKLRMTKVEEGVCGGKVMWHAFETKSKEEEKVMDGVWERRRKEKEERRRVQKENVERKKREKRDTAGEKKWKEGEQEEDEEEDEMDVDEEEEWDSEGLEDE